VLFVSSTCCSPIQSSSSSGDMTSLSSGSTSDDMRVGMMVGEVSCMNSTCGRPSVSGRPPISVSRPKDTSFGRGRGRVAVSIFGGGEARGECEGESPPSREDDMLAVLAVAWKVFDVVSALCTTWAALAPYGTGETVIGRRGPGGDWSGLKLEVERCGERGLSADTMQRGETNPCFTVEVR
jgi:hypothetical protein